MALQPASGARDLLPQDVGANRWICERLAQVYQLWGYSEVTPPSIERLDTLEAGGAICSEQVLQVVADEPLGLRPEMTASIARAACTRLGNLQRPLRLHYSGSIFLAERTEGENPRINEQLQSGVELMGSASPAGDAELLRLLIDAAGHLPLAPHHAPCLLIGHQGLLELVLAKVEKSMQQSCRRALCQGNQHDLKQLTLPPDQLLLLERVIKLRGAPALVLQQLSELLGEDLLLEQLGQLLAALAPIAAANGIRLQLDPSFQPQFALYDGLVMQLVCRGPHAPVAVANGGRYNNLVNRFSPSTSGATGVGFSFAVGDLRQLLGSASGHSPESNKHCWLVAFQNSALLNPALDRLQQCHSRGEQAELWPQPCESKEEAEKLASARGLKLLDWLS